MADLMVLPRPANACTMAQASAEKLEHTRPAEKERVTSVPENSRQVYQSRLCQKEQSRMSRAPDRKVGEGQDEREPHLGEKEGYQGGSMGRKEWTPQ